MAPFNETLTPLTTRRVREHQILHVAAELPEEDDTIDKARREILKWAQRRSGSRLSPAAMAGRNFEMLAAGRNSSAVEVDLPEIQAWALRQEDPDKDVAGRIWTSEAILWRIPGGLAKFAARLIVVSNEPELSIVPAGPGYIRQLIKKMGLKSNGQAISAEPWFIENDNDQNALLDLLENPARRLPVIVFSDPDRNISELGVNVHDIAAGLAGLATVAVIYTDTSWLLTERFNKRLSVFDRGIRIYFPGFNADADPYKHPLWLGSRLHPNDEGAQVERQIRMRIAQFSIRAVRMGEHILPFSQLRSASRKAEEDKLAASGASDTEKLAAAVNRISALEKELKDAKELEQYALDEERNARIRADDAESRERNSIAQIQNLQARLARTDAANDEQLSLPKKWSDFEEWCNQALVGSVSFTSAAKSGCKKPLFRNVEQAARCLLWLADKCRNRLLNGGGSLRDETVEDGIRNASCGGDKFMFNWQSQQICAEWHIKTGGNTRAPEHCLRIYYGWDYQTQQIIIADMPAHRKTRIS